MTSIDKLIKLLLESYDDSTRARVMIFCFTLIGILFIVDTMLLQTYPAFTLIGFIILLGAFLDKTIAKHNQNKPKPWDNYKPF